MAKVAKKSDFGLNSVQSRLQSSQLRGPSVCHGGPKFKIKHKSRCLEKIKLVNWGAKHVDWGGQAPPWRRPWFGILDSFFISTGDETSIIQESMTQNSVFTIFHHVTPYLMSLTKTRQSTYENHRKTCRLPQVTRIINRISQNQK